MARVVSSDSESSTGHAELRMVALDQLVPHPDNPRLQLREDIVERITAEVGLHGFGQEHALLVRPKSGVYEIVAGHQRVESAKRAGLTDLPCWVKHLDDAEAFMQLVLGNAQGELSPLEIGMHVLKAVPLAQGGPGKHGGLSEYAERTGIQKAYVTQIRKAAEVAATVQQVQRLQLGTKCVSLYEISKVPREIWPLLVDQLLAEQWNRAETVSKVEKIRKFEIPVEHAYWLPYVEVVEAYLRRDRPNPATVYKLVSTAEKVFSYIDTERTYEDRAAFETWLREHSGKEAWKPREISRYHAELIGEAVEDGLPDDVDLRHGDFREVLAKLSDVDAIITDPPYPEEFLPLFADLSKVAASILKPGGICAVMVGQSYLPQVVAALGGSLSYHWTLAYLTPGGQAVQLWDRKVNTFWKPVLVYVKDKYAGDWMGDVTRSDVNDNDKKHHNWGQSESGMADLIERLTEPEQLICDPFLGGGTTAFVAKKLGRRFVGCDIDEACIVTTADRFAEHDEGAAK